MSTISASTTTTTAYKVTADTTGTLVLQTGSTPTTAVTIDGSQNVGVGVTPSAWAGVKALQINTGGAISAFSNELDISLNSYYNGGYKYVGTGRASLYLQYDGQHQFLTAASGTAGNAITFTQAMTLDASGNLLVNSTGTVGAGKIGIAFDGSPNNGIGLKETGNFSGAGFCVFQNSAGTTIGSIARVTTTNAVVYNTTSDQRLKSNIEDAAPVLNKLMNVKVRQYDWTEGDLHQDYGFIAQELELVLSGIVTKGKTEEDVWQLDYSRLTPHLVKAIQEQQAIIEQLTNRITALEAK